MSIISVNEPSIFIPHVFSNTSDSVESVFVELFGRSSIDRVDIVRHSEDVCRAYVHFTSWPNTAQGRKLREKLLSGETVKVVYSEPRFWKCVASKISKPQPREEQGGGFFRGPYIEVDDMMVKCVSKDESRGGGGRTHQHPRHQHQQEHQYPRHYQQDQHQQQQYQGGRPSYSDNRNVPMRRVAFHSGGGYQEQPHHIQEQHTQRRHQIKPAKHFKNKQWVRKEDSEDKSETIGVEESATPTGNGDEVSNDE